MSRARVRLADPARDRPRAGLLMGVGAGALVAGLALAAALAPSVSQPREPAADTEGYADAPTKGKQPTDEGATTTARAKRHAKRRPAAAPAPAGAGPDGGLVADAASRDAATSDAAVDAGGDAAARDGGQDAATPDAADAAALVASTAPGLGPDAGSAAAPAASMPEALASEALMSAPMSLPASPKAQRTAPVEAVGAAASNAPVEAPADVDVRARAEGPSDADLRAREAAAERAALQDVEPGVVAYVHCEGVDRKPGRYPCPRDARLEREVWDTLARLGSCEQNAGRGDGEVRLDFRRGRRVRVTVRDRSKSGNAIHVNAVNRCVGERLQSLRSRLRPARMIVSFRFRLR